MTATPSTMLPLGTPLPDFELPGLEGDVISSSTARGAPATLVMFLCPHCPFVRHTRMEIGRLCREFREDGLISFGINSNDTASFPQDGPQGMKEEVAIAGYPFPYLRDESQAVAKAFKAACTPDFFLFDKDLKLVYRGQLDSSRPGNGIPVTGDDLRTAVKAVLRGERPSSVQKPGIGCNIKWKAGNQPSYF